VDHLGRATPANTNLKETTVSKSPNPLISLTIILRAVPPAAATTGEPAPLLSLP
jgi:hypothetical protein